MPCWAADKYPFSGHLQPVCRTLAIHLWDTCVAREPCKCPAKALPASPEQGVSPCCRRVDFSSTGRRVGRKSKFFVEKFGGNGESLYLCTRSSKTTCGNSSVGRAQPCQGWGREFESRFPLHLFPFLFMDARMVESVDTRDLKSLGHCGCAGSSPASSTK